MITKDLEEIYCIEAVSKEYDAVLFDVWGVIITDSVRGEKVEPKIAAHLGAIMKSKPVYFVSNYSSDPESLEAKLQGLGISVAKGSVFTAGGAAKDLLSDFAYLNQFFSNYKAKSQPKYFHLGIESEYNVLPAIGFQKTDKLEDADLLLIAVQKEHPEQNDLDTTQMLKKASLMKMPALCLNPDAHFTDPSGTVYCAGYFASRYEKMGGEVLYIGKPFEQIFLHVFRKTNLNPKSHKILMVGDTLTTDILGGNTVGIDTALVTTGNTGIQLQNNNQLALSKIRLQCQLHRIFPTYVVSMSM